MGLGPVRDAGALRPGVNIVATARLSLGAFRMDARIRFDYSRTASTSAAGVRKMSKSFYNVVNPDYARRQLRRRRMYEMAISSLEQVETWDFERHRRCAVPAPLQRLFHRCDERLPSGRKATEQELPPSTRPSRRSRGVDFSFNTSVAAFMISTSWASVRNEVLRP